MHELVCRVRPRRRRDAGSRWRRRRPNDSPLAAGRGRLPAARGERSQPGPPAFPRLRHRPPSCARQSRRGAAGDEVEHFLDPDRPAADAGRLREPGRAISPQDGRVGQTGTANTIRSPRVTKAITAVNSKSRTARSEQTKAGCRQPLSVSSQLTPCVHKGLARGSAPLDPRTNVRRDAAPVRTRRRCGARRGPARSAG